MLKIIAVNSNLHDLLQYKSIGKIPELSDVSQNLISVCEKILQTLHLIYQHQDNNDYFVEMTIFNIRKLIRWKSPLPATFFLRSFFFSQVYDGLLQNVFLQMLHKK